MKQIKEKGVIEEYLRVFRCPYCRATLRQTADGIECTKCYEKFPITLLGQIDFRLKKEKSFEIKLKLDPAAQPKQYLVSERLPLNRSPKQNFRGKGAGHVSSGLASYFPKSRTQDSLVLDLGCGSTPNRCQCEEAGFKYVGLDFDSDKATILGDAHALPFEDETFEFVISIAVLEHLRFPLVALSEIYRVLRRGSKFIGSVAFLEPHHGNSYYHFTHLGLINALESANFKIILISANHKWDVLTAQAKMILLIKMPNIMIKAVLAPLRMLHAIWWKAGTILYPDKAKGFNKNLRMAGSFMFIAEKT